MSAGNPGFNFNQAGFAGHYDRYFVPRFFNQWAELLLSRVGVAIGDHVLDVATGPGTLARIAAQRVGPKGRVVGTDLSPAMLEIARAKPAVEGAKIEYVQSAASPLAALDTSYDVVVCQQGLQFFPDRRGAIEEMARTMKRGGWMGLAVWTTIERNTLFNAMREGLLAAGLKELGERANTPFSWHAPDELRVMMHEVGLKEIVLETWSLPTVWEEGPEQVVAAVSAMPIANDISALAPDAKRRFEQEVRAQLKPFVDTRGAVRATMVSTVAVGRKP
ncbi:MAG TPA: methyltransferase domain-containing protein [bacterium]|nr:methyltransferase domain-containing protein [bacterium]